MNKLTSDQVAFIEAQAKAIRNQGAKGPPMTARAAMQHLARNAADGTVRALARARIRQGEPVLSVGRRFERANPEAVGPRYGDKLARRIERRRAIRAASYIERVIDRVRKRNADTRAMASNSHEARRVIDEDRRLERAKR
jgi:hypothetical protein